MMRKQDAQTIVNAMLQIRKVLEHYPDGEDTYIGVDVSTTTEEENFFMSDLKDLMELDLKVGLRTYPDVNYPYEVYCFLKGVEIHCICNREALEAQGFENIPEVKLPNYLL